MSRVLLAVLLAVLATACTTPAEQRAASASATPPAAPVVVTTTTTAPSTTTTTTTAAPTTTTTTTVAPVWVVGATQLPLRADGFGQILPTPEVLRNRALPTADVLPAPTSGRYESTNRPVPADVLARSTWHSGCPVGVAELRYLTMSFWGFDNRPHTGEMIVNASVADDVVRVFNRLWDAKFPLEEMRVTAAPELSLHPTGDGNNTGAFVCRNVRTATTWSAHAYGLAIDVNPFCNPYTKGDLVLPELASAYTDRSWKRPGMVVAGDTVVSAFTSIGWTWGGTWTSPKDIQHFSANGR